MVADAGGTSFLASAAESAAWPLFSNASRSLSRAPDAKRGGAKVKHIADPSPELPLFELPERDGPNLAESRLKFEGPEEDAGGRRERRLGEQLGTIFRVIRDGEWRTLAEIAEKTSYPAPSVSAQLRHLRKPHYGAFIVEKRHVRNGVFEYRLALDEIGKPRRSK